MVVPAAFGRRDRVRRFTSGAGGAIRASRCYRALLSLVVAWGLALSGNLLLGPTEAYGQTSADVQKKRRKKRARRAKRRRRARRRAQNAKATKARRVSARQIKRWQRKGWTDARILAEAQKAGYRVTKRQKNRLRKLRVRRSLRLALAEQSAAASSNGPRFNLNKEIDPNDIDFDSVPPPDGMPKEIAEAQRRDAQRRRVRPAGRAAASNVRRPVRVPIRKPEGKSASDAVASDN